MLSVTHSASPARPPFFGCHPTIEGPVIIHVEGEGGGGGGGGPPDQTIDPPKLPYKNV